ncbi:hypothetical protein BBJ28_00006278, partial [Nothophytophthora sp. Chile5]
TTRKTMAGGIATLLAVLAFATVLLVQGTAAAAVNGVIVVRGNKMYNAKTGERFFMKGMTYEYAVSDEYYDKYSKAAIADHLDGLDYNTLRLYNINPTSSYKNFMTDMAALGVYVLVSASPDNDEYYGKYRYSTITKSLSCSGAVSSGSGTKTVDQTETCYPALLLEYGKKIIQNFAQYDNTLGVVVANEIMQADLTAGSCVKAYVSDMKSWMSVNGKKVRILPLAYAAADSSYGTEITNADDYHVLKIQGLLCGDKMTDGMMVESIDIYLINEYRWCPDSTFAEAYQRYIDMAQGVPIVIAFGEYGCKSTSSVPREWGMIQYLYDEPSATKEFSEVWSGGLAYSYGEAKLSSDSLFPMFTGGSTDFLGTPSSKSTTDYTNLKTKFAKYSGYSDPAAWSSDGKCTWSPDVATTTQSSNERATKYGWIVSSCSSDHLKVVSTDSWTCSSREGVVCTDDGDTCDVTLSSAIGTTQEDICGTYEVTSGGGTCDSTSDCGGNGQCKESNGTKSCSCLSCYTGSDCSVKDISTCATLSSSSSAPKAIFVGVGVFLGVMAVVFIALAVAAAKKKAGTCWTQRVYLGRPGNNVKIGIVGVPNVGKSTFFNCLSKLNIPAENFPFCTIEPNEAVVPLPDQRFNWLVEHVKPQNTCVTDRLSLDIAGLVRGASEGAGLGNNFLSHIQAVDAIYHMVRGFDSKDVTHLCHGCIFEYLGNVDPVRDMQIIQDELRLKDLALITKTVDGMKKHVEKGVGGKEKKLEYDALVHVQEWLESGKDVSFGKWSAFEVDILNTLQLLTAKPVVYLINVSKRDYLRKSNKYLPKIAEYVKERGGNEPVIPLSCEFELELLDLDASGELETYMKENPTHKSILNRVLKVGYQALGLIHYFTFGKVEVRGWTIRKGRLAPQAAGVIHSDFEKGFIKAEVQAFADLKERKFGSEEAVKKAGKLKQQGKNYEAPRVYLGRPGNNVKIGIVGVPNVGKSTFFNCLSKLHIPAENFPFCTIDPNDAVVPLPDQRFNWLVDKYKPASVVPPVISITDIAGLVRGAAEGAGLGNAFLSHIQAVDAIYHMVRAFDSTEVTHVEGNVDPVRDIKIIQEELRLKDIDRVVKTAEGMKKNVERGLGGKEKKLEYEALMRIQEWLEAGKDVSFGTWSAFEVEVLNTMQLLTAKPVVYLINVSKRDYLRKSNKYLPKIAEFIKERGGNEMVIPLSCEFELEMLDLDAGGQLEAYMKENPTHKSILNRVLKMGYHALGLIHFFTAGKDEVRGWTIRKGRLAPQAAGVIHTDFEKGFIMAEVQAFADLKELGTEEAVKKAGKLKQQGKKYEMQDGDIVFFKFNN